MRTQCLTSAVRSTSGPTIIPGQSIRLSTGMSKASQSWMKRAPLSAPSESMAPARWCGLLAITPIGWPSTRMKAVMTPMPNFSRISSTEPTSAMVCTISFMS